MADVASLAVALHLNSAGFKSQIVDAYRSAETASKGFTAKAQQESLKTSDALAKIGDQARGAGAQIRGLNGHIASASGGFEQFRNVVSSVASGSNIAVSTIANAMIPSLERLLTGLNGASSGWEAQKQATRQAAAEFEAAATNQIAMAQAARTQAQAQQLAAQRTRDQAQASRAQAQELARYYATQTQVNQQYGLSVSYQKEYTDISRQVREANIAEAAAKVKVAEATQAVQAADLAESAGKVNLITALEQVSLANQKVSFTSKAASVATGMMNGALSLVGGLPGLGIMAAVSAIAALYSAFEKASDETKAFNAAILTNFGDMGVTVGQMRQLANQLGDTEGAVKSVTAAVKAGFTGDMLDQVAALGTQLNELGGNADELVSQLSSLRGDPLKAIQDLTSQGLVFNASQIEQIASLQRQGNMAEAAAIAQRMLLDQVSEKLKNQQTDLQNNTNWWINLKTAVKNGFTAMAQADIDNARVMSNMMGVDMDQPSRDAQASAEKQKKTAEERQKQAAKEQDAALARIKVESEINAAIKAGADPKKEAVRLTAEITAEYKAGKLTLDQYHEALKGVDKQYGDHKKASTAGINEGQEMLLQLQKQEAVLRAQNDDSNKLTDSQKKLAAFNAQIAGFDRGHLTLGQKSISAVQDQVRAQLQVNAGLEKANAQHSLSVRLQEQNAELTQQTVQKQQAASDSLAEMTMSSPVYEQMSAEQQIRNDFAERRLKLAKEVTDHSSMLYSQETAYLANEQQRQLDIVQTTAAEKSKIEGSYSLGFKKGVADWADAAGNAYAQMRDFATSSFDTMAGSLATFATTGRLNFGSMAKSIIADLIKIQLQVNASGALQSLFGIGGSIIGGLAGATAAGAGNAVSSGSVGLSTDFHAYANAKGGVYSSPDLSQYRNQVVNQPTFFAFAKGAGLMGEAGEEAIMPLTRGQDGSLGVRAVGNHAQQAAATGAGAAPQVYITINSDGGTNTQASAGYQQFGQEVGDFVDGRFKTLLNKSLGQGGAITNAIRGRRA